MGRMRSRRRTDEMNKIKRERNEKKELARLKKVLGIVDTDDNLQEKVMEIGEIKTAAQIKRETLAKEEADIIAELRETNSKGEDIEVINDKTNVKHVYNTKTGRDQFGCLPPWKQARRTERKMRKVNHSRKLNFKQAWCAKFVPLD